MYFLQSAGRFPTKWKCGYTTSRLFCFTCTWCAGNILPTYKCFLQNVSLVQIWTLLSSLWTCGGRFPTHESQKFPAHTLKIWNFLSSVGNIIPALQPPNTGTLSPHFLLLYHILIAPLALPTSTEFMHSLLMWEWNPSLFCSACPRHSSNQLEETICCHS